MTCSRCKKCQSVAVCSVYMKYKDCQELYEGKEVEKIIIKDSEYVAVLNCLDCGALSAKEKIN